MLRYTVLHCTALHQITTSGRDGCVSIIHPDWACRGYGRGQCTVYIVLLMLMARRVCTPSGMCLSTSDGFCKFADLQSWVDVGAPHHAVLCRAVPSLVGFVEWFCSWGTRSVNMARMVVVVVVVVTHLRCRVGCFLEEWWVPRLARLRMKVGAHQYVKMSASIQMKGMCFLKFPKPDGRKTRLLSFKGSVVVVRSCGTTDVVEFDNQGMVVSTDHHKFKAPCPQSLASHTPPEPSWQPLPTSRS